MGGPAVGRADAAQAAIIITVPGKGDVVLHYRAQTVIRVTGKGRGITGDKAARIVITILDNIRTRDALHKTGLSKIEYYKLLDNSHIPNFCGAIFTYREDSVPFIDKFHIYYVVIMYFVNI